MTSDSVKLLALRLVEEEIGSRRYAERSKLMMKRNVLDFLRWASRRGTADIRALTKKDLVSFHASLCKQRSKKSGESLAPSTINARFQNVLFLYSCLYRGGVILANPGHGLELKVAEPAGWKRRPLTRDEINRFLEAIDVSTIEGQRDRTLFELIYSSGLRVSEAAALTVGDIDFERRLMVVRGKFDRDRMVPISEVARDFLLRFLGFRIERASSWVFPGYKNHLAGGSVSARFRELLRRFNMDRPEISAHSIRHSTATHLLENGASIRHVQELLGHRNIESTVRYTHVMTDGLAKVYRKHHPREHDLFEVADAEYERRLSTLLAGKRKEC